MSALGEHLEDYLRMRRALGVQLGLYRERLRGFPGYLEATGASTVTVDLAVAWAWLPDGIKPITASYRLSTVRGFARYLHASTRRTRFRHPVCSRCRGGGRRLTCIHPKIWPGCWR